MVIIDRDFDLKSKYMIKHLSMYCYITPRPKSFTAFQIIMSLVNRLNCMESLIFGASHRRKATSNKSK